MSEEGKLVGTSEQPKKTDKLFPLKADSSFQEFYQYFLGFFDTKRLHEFLNNCLTPNPYNETPESLLAFLRGNLFKEYFSEQLSYQQNPEIWKDEPVETRAQTIFIQTGANAFSRLGTKATSRLDLKDRQYFPELNDEEVAQLRNQTILLNLFFASELAKTNFIVPK